MILYLKAHSKKMIGYIPDWIRFIYEENDMDYELTLEIRGTIDHSDKTLDCRCKDEFVPWVLRDLESGDETDLTELLEDEIEERFSDEFVADCICNSTSFEVGIYPIKGKEMFESAENDKLNNCEGTFVINEKRSKKFTFDVELNIY